MVNEKLKCTCCGNERKSDDFYASSSLFHKATNKTHVCKQCIWDFAEETDANSNYDIKKIQDTLRMIDKPFLKDLWKATMDESEKSGKQTFRLYMKNLGMRQNRELNWSDSDIRNEVNNKIVINEFTEEEQEIAKEEIHELMRFWGKGFELDHYIWLQTEYEDFVNRYECDSKGMELLIKQICLTELDIEIRRSGGEKVDQQLKTLQDLLGSSNLKPVQETGANAVEQESFGTLIKKFERERPVPEPDSVWKDVDGIGKYIRTFFLGHMAKAVGVENRFQDEYDEEISKHTITKDYLEDSDLDE
jgi:hypothetical protein